MSQLIEITPSQSLGWQGLAEALAEQGLACQLVETSPLSVSLDGSDAGDVAHVLETWLSGNGSTLVPQVVDGEHIVLRPPAA
jgi:hypothetical protein